MRKNQCSICDNPSVETLLLLKGLKKRLIQKNNKSDQEYQQIKQDDKNNHMEMFSKLIDMISFKENQQNGCKHQKIYRDFYRKTRCSQATFKHNCQEVLNELAQKNFQLDTMCHQILMIEQRVLKMKILQKNGQNKRRIKAHQRESNLYNPKTKQAQNRKNYQIIQKKQQAHQIVVKNQQQIQQVQQVAFQQSLPTGSVVIFPFLYGPM